MSLPPQQFCVRWNSYHTNLQTVFPKLLSTENFVDVTLACENRQIKCHKVVLSACSTYFERLLIQNPCKHPIIFMKDMRFSEMQSLVDFMYKGEVNVSQDDLPSLLKSAEALQIRGLCGSDSGGSNGNESSSETNETRLNSNQSKEGSPQHNTESQKETLPKPNSEPQTQNTQSNDLPSNGGTIQSNVVKKRKEQSHSPESEYKVSRKSGDQTFKEEMVEEDGLFYGEMENDDADCGDQIDDEVLPNSNTTGHQTSEATEKSKKKQQIFLSPDTTDDFIIKRLQHSPRLSIKMFNVKKTNNENLPKNDNNENIPVVHTIDDGLDKDEQNTENIDRNSNSERVTSLIISDESEIDSLIYENEDYLKQWLLKNHELEVSLSTVNVNSNTKYNSKPVGYRKNHGGSNSVMTLKNLTTDDDKNWLQHLRGLSSDQLDVKDGIIKSVDKSYKRKMKTTGIDEMAAFLEPSDLDQFLAGKEVSSSGISRKAIEQAMMGKYNPNRRYSNQAMWAALMDVKKGGSIYRAAQTHKVPRKSLRNWMKRWHIKSSFPMPQQLKQFVENNRKHKMELRREFTNTLLSLGSRLNMTADESLTENIYDANNHDQIADAPVLKNKKMITNPADYLECSQIIDMSGNVLFDEDIAHVTMNASHNGSGTASDAQSNSLQIKKQILFSDVEQLAGLSQSKVSDGANVEKNV